MKWAIRINVEIQGVPFKKNEKNYHLQIKSPGINENKKLHTNYLSKKLRCRIKFFQNYRQKFLKMTQH